VPVNQRLENSLKSVEDEFNLIKNQIQQTLLDVREHILDATNPFTTPGFPDGLEEQADSAAMDSVAGTDQTETSDGPTEEGESEETTEEPGEEPEEEILETEVPEGLEGDEILEEGGVDWEPGDEIVEESDAPDGNDIVFEEGGPAGSVEGEEEGEEDEEEVEGEEDPEAYADGDLPDAMKELHAGALDLISLASLVRWVAITMERIGRARLEILLDAYQMSGRVSPEVRDVARTLCELAEEEPDGRIPVRDIVAAMMRLEGVLGSDEMQSNRLLSLVFEDEFEPLGSPLASLGFR